MKTVIDSDIFIDFLRLYEPAKLWFQDLDAENTLFSAVTEAELLSGNDCNNEIAMNQTLKLLGAYIKAVVTNDVAKKAGELRRVYNVPLIDAFIAATAILNEATLITRNIKDYAKIKGIKLKKPYP